MKNTHKLSILGPTLLLAALCLPSNAYAGDKTKEPVFYDIAPAEAQDTEPVIMPDATYMFAQRDTCELYLDVYEPTKGSQTKVGGREKPTIMFVFGGGFISGRRDGHSYLPWFRTMTENGYRIVSIDYRLGLKGSTSVGVSQVNVLDRAIHAAVEDLYSATAFLIDNAEAFGINADNIVISGSSAGAITVLQAEWELCNRTSLASVLPDNFQYAGVISFSGGILSREGNLKFAKAPCPIMLFHGTKDKLVNYKQIKVFKLGFFGSDKIAKRLQKFGYDYNILRYAGNGHEIAGIMGQTVREQTTFIEENVMQALGKRVDSTVSDPNINSSGSSQSRKELYGK